MSWTRNPRAALGALKSYLSDAAGAEPDAGGVLEPVESETEEEGASPAGAAEDGDSEDSAPLFSDGDTEVEPEVVQAGPVGEDAELQRGLLQAFARHNISHAAMEDVLDVFKNASRESIDRLPTFRTIKNRHSDKLPTIVIDFDIGDLQEDGEFEISSHFNQPSIPRSLVSKSTPLMCSVTRVSVRDALAFHVRLHPHHPPVKTCSLAADGVPVTKRTRKSFEIMSLQFPLCKSVYPLRVFLAELKTSSFDVLGHVQQMVAELADAGLHLDFVVADLPKKADLLGLRHCGGFYACTYCTIEGVHGSTSGTLSYPESHRAAAEPRTHESTLEIVNHRDYAWASHPNHRSTFKHQLKGVLQRTPLLDVPLFDVVNDVPVEYMHAVHLGVIKKTFQRSFLAGTTITGFKRLRQTLDEFNLLYPQEPHPREQTRRPVAYASHWKATQYRLLVMGHLPFLLEVLDKHPDPDAHLLRSAWALLGLLSRVLLMDNGPQLNRVNQLLPLQSAMEEFLSVYEEYCGADFMNFNVHMFSHALQARDRFGSLSRVSAYSSETMYQHFQRGYTAGTQSPGKQGMLNLYLQLFSGHQCKHSFTTEPAAPGDRRMSQDQYIYDDRGAVYEVLNITDDTFQVHSLPCTPFKFKTCRGTDLPFGAAGLLTRDGQDSVSDAEVTITVAKSSVRGKAIVSEKYVSCLPYTMLYDGN